MKSAQILIFVLHKFFGFDCSEPHGAVLGLPRTLFFTHLLIFSFHVFVAGCSGIATLKKRSHGENRRWLCLWSWLCGTVSQHWRSSKWPHHLQATLACTSLYLCNSFLEHYYKHLECSHKKNLKPTSWTPDVAPFIGKNLTLQCSVHLYCKWVPIDGEFPICPLLPLLYSIVTPRY